MSALPPTVKAPVAVAVFCDAGRRLTHPTRPGWERPCMRPGSEDFCIVDDDLWLKVCTRHMAELVADGLAQGGPPCPS